MRPRIIIMAFCVICYLPILAEQTITVNKICYDLNHYHDASVTFPEGGNIYGYTGNIVIPATITYAGETYDVRKIGYYAFKGQENLISVTIPSSINYIESQGVFFASEKLRAIYVDSNNENFCDVDGVLFSKGKWKIYCYPPAKTISKYKIPESVTFIEDFCFAYCKNLVTITIPSKVYSIGYGAFVGCSSLREVRYPRGLDLSSAEIPSTTKLIPYDIEPPLLALVNSSLSFSDPTKNNYIDANEKCTIKFKIQNNGKGAAQDCEARVKLSGATSGISVRTIKLPEIAVGQTYEVSIPITSNTNTENGQVTFSIEVYEPNGWGVAPFDLSVATKAFEAPLLQVVDYKITSNSGNIRKMEPFTFTFNLQNTKYGDAENIKVKINIPNNVFVMDGSSELSYPIIKSGETKNIKISLAANNNYASTNIPITIDIKEKYGKFAENRNIDIALNQTTSTVIDIAGTREEQKRGEIKLATMGSNIDRNIPESQILNMNTLVLIIANERYDNMPQVPYALNDGNIFKEYCVKTLGIPDENILYQSNATLNGIRQKIDLLQKKAQARANARKETNIIVYYTGHGVPDINTRGAYLMPIDGYEENITTGYKLDDLYQQLGKLPAKSITVFLDACFSGVNRNDEALAQNKGARLVAKSGMPVGNMVVFAASQGNQTAFVNDKEQHGLFTYYLLKKLQESKGDVTLDVLANYLTEEVNIKSLNLHEKEQIPSIIASPQVQNQWQNWKLK